MFKLIRRYEIRHAAWAMLLLSIALMLGACDNPAPADATRAVTPIKVKIVLVTMFEIGADSGDTAGEFQLWKERRNLDQVFPFHAHHDLHFSSEESILVIVAGAGTAKAAASIMALFDLAELANDQPIW